MREEEEERRRREKKALTMNGRSDRFRSNNKSSSAIGGRARCPFLLFPHSRVLCLCV
jgi:hypothetical protein